MTAPGKVGELLRRGGELLKIDPTERFKPSESLAASRESHMVINWPTIRIGPRSFVEATGPAESRCEQSVIENTGRLLALPVRLALPWFVTTSRRRFFKGELAVSGHGNTIRTGLQSAREAMLCLAGLARDLLPNDRDLPLWLEARVRASSPDDFSEFKRYVALLTSPKVVSAVGNLVLAYEERFFLGVIPDFYAIANIFRGREKIGDLSDEDRQSVAMLLKTVVDDAMRCQRALGELNGHLARTMGAAFCLKIEAQSGLGGLLLEEVSEGRALFHDSGNVLTTFNGVVQLVGLLDLEDAMAVLRRGLFDLSNLDALIESVAFVLANEAERFGVKVETSSPGTHLPLPPIIRRRLFRTMFELAMNGLKNSDSAKPRGGRILKINAGEVSGAGKIRILVEDNGVGIGGRGAVSALGSGKGLEDTVRKVARRHNWTLNFDSKLGQGTQVSLDVPAEQFAETDANVFGDGSEVPLEPLDVGVFGSAVKTAVQL